MLPNFLLAHTDYERVEAYDEEPLNKTAQNQPKAQKTPTNQLISGKFCRLPVITLFSGESVR